MAKLSDPEVRKALGELPRWKQNGAAIERTFEFPSFLPGIEFVNRVARAAEEAQHHPDITINYNKVTLSLTSHDSGGVTARDLNLAKKIDALGG
jgi:4a-hydroxytetrahydrobiopterin dehydratase